MLLFWIALGKIFAASIMGFLGSAIFFITSFPNRLGSRYLDHHFSEKLEEFKSDQQSSITRLKSQLDQLLDRGIRANEKEFNATILVWEKLIAAYIATNICVTGFIQHPDLNNATPENVDSFLSQTEFSDDQKKRILSSTDRNRAFSNQVRRIDMSKAQDAIYEARICLMKESIFIADEIKRRISTEIDLYHGARIEQWMNLQDGRIIPETKTTIVLTDGLANLTKIESMLKDRINNF